MSHVAYPKRICKPWADREIWILRRLAGSVSAKGIGSHLGRSAESVKSKAQEFEISLRQNGEKHHASKYSDAFVENCRQLHESGISQRKLARNLNVPIGTLRQWLEFRQRTNDQVSIK